MDSTLRSFRIDPVDGELFYADELKGLNTPSWITLSRRDRIAYLPETAGHAVNVIRFSDVCDLQVIEKESGNTLTPYQLTFMGGERYGVVVNAGTELASIFEIGARGDLSFLAYEKNGSFATSGVSIRGSSPDEEIFVNTAAVENQYIVSKLILSSGKFKMHSKAKSKTLFPTAITRVGNFFISSGRASDQLSVFEVDANSGDIKVIDPFPIAAGVDAPGNIAVHPDQRYFFPPGGRPSAFIAVFGNADGVFKTFKMSLDTGKLTPIEVVKPIPSASAVDGAFLRLR